MENPWINVYEKLTWRVLSCTIYDDDFEIIGSHIYKDKNFIWYLVWKKYVFTEHKKMKEGDKTISETIPT